MVVLIEVLEELLKGLLDLRVDPRSVAKLNHQVQRVDHRQMLKADLVVLQVVENEANHADSLLFVAEVKDFSDVLNHIEGEVLEASQSEFVVTEDPEAAADVVGDLWVLVALWGDQHLLEVVEPAVLNESLGDLVDLQEVHE